MSEDLLGQISALRTEIQALIRGLLTQQTMLRTMDEKLTRLLIAATDDDGANELEELLARVVKGMESLSEGQAKIIRSTHRAGPLMLTYRTGAVAGLSGGKAMAAHLMEATLPREAADLAAYYRAGAEALSENDLRFRDLARQVVNGSLSREDAESEAANIERQGLLAGLPQLPQTKDPEDERAHSYGQLVGAGWMGLSDVKRLWAL